MGLNIGNINNSYNSMIDKVAFSQVQEKILNPEKNQAIDINKLDLSKFNRVSQGTDLYAARTSNETALQASKAATDFGVNFSKEFNANLQYLNSIAAQSLLSAQEVGAKNGLIGVEITNQVNNEKDVIIATTKTTESQDLNKDKRGSNPFIPMGAEAEGTDNDEYEPVPTDINIFA